MRIFTASIATETNTFAPWPTGRNDFAPQPGEDAYTLVAKYFRERALADGHEHVQSLVVSAEPSGPTVQSIYEEFRDQVLDDLRACGQVDAVLMPLHGAMVATGCEDCEGDLLARIREIVGSRCMIGAMLDPHCHLTPQMVASANVLIALKEYPHIDFLERAAEVYDICIGATRGTCDPVSAVFDCRMVGSYPTMVEPMRGLLSQIHTIEEQKGILSISFVHGFPWGDTQHSGSKVLVIADGDTRLARETAAQVGKLIYARRMDLLPKITPIGSALDEALRATGCTVLADFGDNAGGGAPSDNVSMLRAMLERKIDGAAFGVIWDPVAASVCAQAGVGAEFALRLGGKSGPASGDAIDINARVKAIDPTHTQTGLGSEVIPLGLSIWIEVAGIDVVIGSKRTQVFSPDAFSILGIGLKEKKLVVVKSSQHFRAGFEPIADQIIIVSTPGALQMDFGSFDYKKKKDLKYFPRVPDPLGLG